MELQLSLMAAAGTLKVKTSKHHGAETSRQKVLGSQTAARNHFPSSVLSFILKNKLISCL